jgi:hypothetical protein
VWVIRGIEERGNFCLVYIKNLIKNKLELTFDLYKKEDNYFKKLIKGFPETLWEKCAINGHFIVESFKGHQHPCSKKKTDVQFLIKLYFL